MDHESMEKPDQRGLFEAFFQSGQAALTFLGLCLALVGAFAVFLAATGMFLPHDAAFLQMDAADLCAYQDCRILNFMIHDRVAFGGALTSIGLLYLWLVEFPLKRGLVWSWWALAVSGTAGFISFLTYIGYGYLDTWHGFATLVLVPIFLFGLARSYPRPAFRLALSDVLGKVRRPPLRSAFGAGLLLVFLFAVGLTAAGLTISTVGISNIFVPQDLDYMGLQPAELDAINVDLISLIAHDRAGFGGALFSTGLAMLITLWNAAPSRSLWQILGLSGSVGFLAAIGIHYVVGYTDFVHLFPAFVGLGVLFTGLALTAKGMYGREKP